MWKKQSALDAVRDGLKEVYPRLWRYSFVLTGNKSQADDLAQAACLRAMEKANGFEVGTHLDRWIFRIAQRLWINEMRKQAVRNGTGLAPVEEIELADPAPGPETQLYNREVMMNVLQLPEAQRSTVVLVYVEGYSYREAAMVLDIPIGTVMSRLAIARGKLARQLKTENEVG